MSSSTDWEMPLGVQPKPEHYDYDLDEALTCVVGLRAIIPGDAFTAETLGTERAGNGVLIRDGVVLTIGYLITEAQTIWLHPAEGPPAPGHVLAYDQETGFGLVQALARLDLPVMPIGQSQKTKVSDAVVVAGAGGRKHSVAARIAAKQEFAGNWEYVLDEAIFTAPAHPFWGGAAMIGRDGDLLGIGSLQVQQARGEGQAEPLNMIVPIDILKPILDDLLTSGPSQPTAAAVAGAQRHRGRRQGGGRTGVRGRAGAPGQSAQRRHRARRRRHQGERPRRLFPQGMVAGQGRGGSAVDDLPGRPHFRGARRLGRSQSLPQGPQPALRVEGGS